MSLERPKKPETLNEAQLLDIVFEVAGDNENMIPKGVAKALTGINEKARRAYLWNTLERKAKDRIRRARKKFTT